MPHCSARDICCLSTVSKTWWDALGEEDALWRHLYLDDRAATFSRMPPRFPSCGTWRDVYLRSIRFKRLVIIKTLTRPNEDLRLVLPRITSLYGLKREIRQAQLALDGLYMEDFELFDMEENIKVGIAGNDSLPPTEDIRKLLLLGIRPRNHNAANGQRRDAAWRANLSILADGIILHQVFVGRGEIVSRSLITTNKVSYAEFDFASAAADPYKMEQMLNQANEKGGGSPTSYKTWWRNSPLHPLLQYMNNPVNLLLFIKQYLKAVFRIRFLLDSIVLRGLLTSGFCQSFYRLCMLLFPMVWTSQIKQVFRITNLFFLLVFARDAIQVTSKALVPVLMSSLRVELVRALLRLTFTWETKNETLFSNLIEIAREFTVQLMQRPRDRRWDLENVFRFAYTSPSLMYALSTLLYSGFTRVTDPLLWISLPLYLYSLPIVYCLIVLRIRLFLAQSYVSLLLA